MPELPEVQTTVNHLSRKIVGLQFKDVWCDWPKTVSKAGGLNYLRKTLRGKKIISVYRRAKFIVVDIEGKYSLFVHQKISGHLLYGKWIPYEITSVPKGTGRRPLGGLFRTGWKSIMSGPMQNDPQNKYIRVLFYFSNGFQLALCDLRRFGKIILVEDNKIDHLPEIHRLGPEPLDISYPKFKKLFEAKRGKLKQVLMDPFFIVGIGNIYADEILWYSNLHPLSRVENLRESDIRLLFKNTKKILRKAINMRGSSFDDYRTPSGEKGDYQSVHKAYQRTGQKCSRHDKGVIKRIKIGGRSAHFCSKHQVFV